MNIFLLAIVCSTLAVAKIYLFFAFIYYKKHGAIPSYLLNLSYISVYYYSKLQLGFMKTQNVITNYVKSVPFLNNLFTYTKYKKCTFTEINDRLIICNKFNEEHNLDYNIIIRFNKILDWEYDYYESLEHKQANYKFIMTEITIDDKKFLIYFTTDKYNYLIVNNNIDKHFINYFLKTHYNDLVKDLEIENYTIRIVDHNVNITEFDSSKTLIIKETEYVII
jgi:hypothetical protein